MTIDFYQILKRRRKSLSDFFQSESILLRKDLETWMASHLHEYVFSEEFVKDAKEALPASRKPVEQLPAPEVVEVHSEAVENLQPLEEGNVTQDQADESDKDLVRKKNKNKS
jgi:hypothetical protein